MIEVKHVTKTFDGFRALDGLTMSVPDGSIYGLVGPNGAGKSTILRHITGIYRQDEGEVLVAGEPVYENPAVKARIASIPDELYYFLSASTRDMMRLFRGFYPRFDQKRYEAMKDIFTTVNEKQPIRRLSKGMQKQSAFWLAMCCRPELLVLDEPVDGLDPVMRRQVWSLLMSDVAEYGTTVLVSSHNLRELEDVCDHVGILPWEGPGGAEPFRPSGECGKDAGGLSGEGASAAPRRSGDPPCIAGGAHPHAYHTGERHRHHQPSGGLRPHPYGRPAPHPGGDLYLRAGR